MAKKKTDEFDYALEGKSKGGRIDAPDLPYRPRDPRHYKPNIALIGCGGITATHLAAYKKARYHVVAVCDLDERRARERQQEYFPRAEVYTDYADVLARDDVEVIDAATHPEHRYPIIADAIEAGKHVLSQKPFVVDLAAGRKLVSAAKRKGVKLAVNQNGRWAPHFSYIRQALARGLIGEVVSAHLSVHWDHNGVKGTPFDKIRHLILYDFAIHWFDILSCIMAGRDPKSIYATVAATASQTARPPLLAQTMVEYDKAQASLAFDADIKSGPEDRTYIGGSEGALLSIGPNLGKQSVTLYTPKGWARPRLRGDWFVEGFHGTMAELLCAIEEDREPSNSAENNLKSLELCFAAIAAAERGKPVKPGTVKKLPENAA